MKLEVLKKYEATASGYDELYREEQYRKYKDLLRVSPVLQGDVVLDAGCGTGLLLEYLEEIGAELSYYVGLDLCRKMLLIAKDKDVERKADFVEGDVEYLPFRDKAFDVAFCVTVLDLVPDKRACVSELRRVVRRSAMYTFIRSANPGMEGLVVGGKDLAFKATP